MTAGDWPALERAITDELARARHTGENPLEIYRLALHRIAAAVSADFASVFLREARDPDLLRLICAINWPQSAARFLSDTRIRVGMGPTGRAAALGAAVAVENVFADESLRDWWEPARELGFSSMIALPLPPRGDVAGVLSLYFRDPHPFDAQEQAFLLRVAEYVPGG